MSSNAEAQRLAAFLRSLKNRRDRSYEALAKRSGVSSSALHRYCSGTSVPADFAPVRHFAMECGATQVEMRELHRLWTLADAVRRHHPVSTAIAPAAAPGTPQRRALVAVTALAAVAGAAAWQASVMATRRRR
jgi:transcriptional regulator with XRE-family HTH domain